MALAPLAPWIVPPDYIGAASRGAQLGLSARAQDEQEQSAADRLQLAYHQLAGEERRASEAAVSRREQASAALALKAQQQQAMAQFHHDNMKRQESAAKALLDLHTKTAQETANYHTKLLEQKAGGDKGYATVTTEDPEHPGTVNKVVRRVSPQQYDDWMRAKLNPGTTMVPESPGLLGMFKTPAHLETNAPPTLDQFMATNRPAMTPPAAQTAPAAAALAPRPASSLAAVDEGGISQEQMRNAKPLPREKKGMVRGEVYNLGGKGFWTWDGEKFVR